MRCRICRNEVRFLNGAWVHVVDVGCARVSPDWPQPLGDDED